MIYGMPWVDQSHEDTNTLLVRPELSELANTITGSDAQLGVPLDAIDIFYAGVTPRMTSWRNILRLLRQVKPVASYMITTEPQRFAETSAWWDTPQTFWPDEVTTVNIEQEEFHTQIIQYWQKREISDRFAVLAQRKDNWDGYNSKKPTELTLVHAKHLMEEFLDSIVSAEHSWVTPFISSDEAGNVTAEWYEGKRELHAQIGENEAEYLRVWGTNIDTDMDEGFLNRDNYLALWEWLFHE